MTFLRRMLDGLGSVRTALVLIAVLASLSVAGTLFSPLLEHVPAATRRIGFLFGLSDTFRSPAFAVAGGLFAANVCVCTWRRAVRGWRGAGRTRRRRVGVDAAMHLALVLMILGGVAKARLERVGTGYLFVGVPATTMLDPAKGSELPLGFEVVLRERRTEYYPLSLKIGIRDAATGSKLGLLELKEGAPAVLAGTDLALEILGTAPDGRAVDLVARTGGLAGAVRFALEDGAVVTRTVGRYDLTLVAYRRLIRSVRGRIDIQEDGRTAREAWLEVNGGVVHRGTRISIIAWRKEQSAEEFLGVQYRRDPSAPLFWAGTIVLSALLPIFIVVRRRRAGR